MLKREREGIWTMTFWWCRILSINRMVTTSHTGQRLDLDIWRRKACPSQLRWMYTLLTRSIALSTDQTDCEHPEKHGKLPMASQQWVLFKSSLSPFEAVAFFSWSGLLTNENCLGRRTFCATCCDKLLQAFTLQETVLDYATFQHLQKTNWRRAGTLLRMNLPGLESKCIGWHDCPGQPLRDEKVLSLFKTTAAIKGD